MATTFYATQNDNGIVVRFTLNDADGNPVDLTGASLKFEAKARFSDAEAKVDGDATPDADQAGNTGQGAYTLTSTDLSAADIYDVRVQATWGDGTIITFPSHGANTLEVQAELA